MANTQTKATQKWQSKAGYTVKAFKIKKDIAEAFVRECEKNGESQASVVTRLMLEYVKVDKDTEK